MGQDLFFQYYLVVFLDLLGQRESIRKITSLPNQENEKEKFIELVKNSLGKVKLIRDAFQTYFDASNSNIPNTELVPPEHREEFIISQKCEIHFYGLSDSVVIAVPLTSTFENCTAINGVYSAFIATCGIGLIALSGETSIRAGLDIGIATQIDDREIYGPAFERAVYLEGQLAEYPRFLVGNELISYLTWVENQEPQTRFGVIAKNTAMWCKKMIIQDTDGRFMLDFLGAKLKEAADNNAINKKVVISAWNYVFSQYQKYMAEGNEKLSSRYFRLMHYFQSRKNLWGIV
jgi:hypothetical protein